MRVTKSLALLVLFALLIMPAKGFTDLEEPENALVEVGNKMCPLSGEAVDSMGGPVRIEHNGKMYNLCCKMCAKDFKRNPEKYRALAESGPKLEGHTNSPASQPDEISHEGHSH